MRKYAVIVAGGVGHRAGGDIPKQFRKICGMPMLWWSLKAFHDEDPETKLLLVLHPDYFDLWHQMVSEMPSECRIECELVPGGKSRYLSVKNGLIAISEDFPDGSLVAVHDAARPMLTPDLVNRMWDGAVRYRAAIPVVPVTDSLREKTDDDDSRAVDRSRFWAVQTPQTFDVRLLMQSYQQPESPLFTDDASVVETKGFEVRLVDGDPRNIKVTNPDDFDKAEILIKKQRKI